MTKYRKKSTVIEAIQFDGENLDELQAWSNQTPHVVYAGQLGEPDEPSVTRLVVDTLEGTLFADVGDWVIRNVAGKFYPCKLDIFEATYESIEGGT